MAFLAGCVTTYQPIPKGYTGSTVVIRDSKKFHSYKKSDLFYIEEINGNLIKNSLSESLKVSYGRGFSLITMVLNTLVPTTKATFTIVGQTTFAAPILALTNDTYGIRGTVTFTPEAGKSYIVKGTLGKNYSAIWIEREQDGMIVGEKIEEITTDTIDDDSELPP